MEINTIKELYDAVKSGEICEKDLFIQLDNDCTGFWIKQYKHDEDDLEIKVKETNGYVDIEPLYKLLFPGAKVEWV